MDSVGDLAGRDIVFVMVSSDPDFAAVAAEVLAGGPPGIMIDCSTVSADVSAKVRADAEAVGAALLAAPVSGNPGAVAAGNATLLVSGPADAFNRAESVLRVLGRAVTHVGDGEVARLVKLCHNVFLGVVIESLVEITVLVNKAGVSRTAFLDFLNSSVLGSTFTAYKAHALTELDFTPTFTTSLLRKDLDLGLAAARDLEVPMPLAAVAYQVIQAAIGAGHADQDFAALIVEEARAAGMSLQPEEPARDGGAGHEDETRLASSASSVWASEAEIAPSRSRVATLPRISATCWARPARCPCARLVSRFVITLLRSRATSERTWPCTNPSCT